MTPCTPNVLFDGGDECFSQVFSVTDKPLVIRAYNLAPEDKVVLEMVASPGKGVDYSQPVENGCGCCVALTACNNTMVVSMTGTYRLNRCACSATPVSIDAYVEYHVLDTGATVNVGDFNMACSCSEGSQVSVTSNADGSTTIVVDGVATLIPGPAASGSVVSAIPVGDILALTVDGVTHQVDLGPDALPTSAQILAILGFEDCTGTALSQGEQLATCSDLSSAVNSEATARIAGDDAEAAARIAGDDAEATARATADNNEAATRAAADAALANAVAANAAASVNDGDAAGGALDGTYPNPGLLPAAVATALAYTDCAGVALGVGSAVATCGANDWVEPYELKVGEPNIINPTLNDVGCDPQTAVFSNLVNCTVVRNANGTHTVTPDSTACGVGEWSYDYTVACGVSGSSTASVSGAVNNTLVGYSFAVSSQTAADLTIGLELPGNYTVQWGDGASDTAASGTAVSHTYGTPFTGDVVVQYSACNAITSFTSTVGRWSFDIATLPDTLEVYFNTGSNITTGRIADLKPALTEYVNTGQNTTTGDIFDLKSSLTIYNNQGQNTTFGDIASLKSALTNYVNLGQNTTTGDIADLKPGLEVYSNGGQNTTTGDIADLKPTLTQFYNYGQNTTTGNIADLKPGLIIYYNDGQNTTFGNIADLKPGLIAYTSGGQNTTSGNIVDLKPGLTAYTNEGQNTTTGDIADLKPALNYFLAGGSNTITATSATWNAATTGFRNFKLLSFVPKTSAAVDFALQALTNVVTWDIEKLVDVSGTNAPATAAGITAANAILANGALTVLYN